MKPTLQHTSRPPNGGFALAEMIAIVGIVAVAVLAVTQIVLDAHSLRQSIREKELVAETLANQIREIQGTDFRDIQATHDGRGFSVTTTGDETYDLEALPGDPDGEPGLVTVTVPGPLNDASLLLEVTVNVNWLGRRGPRSMSRTVRLSAAGSVQ